MSMTKEEATMNFKSLSMNRIHEKGCGSTVPPRPFLEAAVQTNKVVIDKIIKKAISNSANQIIREMKKRYPGQKTKPVATSEIKQTNILKTLEQSTTTTIEQNEPINSERQILFEPKQDK